MKKRLFKWTINSYYHYLRVKVTGNNTYLEAIEMPSPTNKIQDRYIAAIQLFSMALFKEYKAIVIGIIVFVIAVLIWIIWNARNSWRKYIKLWFKLIVDIFRFSIKKFRELKNESVDKVE